MSKPDWKDAPEWAMWLAMDGAGKWFWHEAEPITAGLIWAQSGVDRVLLASAPRIDWLETLEPRP